MSRTHILQQAQSLTEAELQDAKDALPLCNEAEHAITGFAYPPSRPIFYVKFGNRDHESMAAEARTHQFVYEALETLPQESRRRVYVPQIYRTINSRQGGLFIVMELIHGRTLKDLYRSGDAVSELEFDDYHNHIAHGLKVLLSIPVPPNAPPGPYEGGYIKHPFFKDFEAPMPFPSVNVLEKYVNKELATWFCKTDPVVTFESQLYLVFSDLYEGNFIFTPSGDLFIIDFDLAAFLPLSFQTFALHHPSLMSSLVAKEIKDQLNLPMENLEVMGFVSGLINMSGIELGVLADYGPWPNVMSI